MKTVLMLSGAGCFLPMLIIFNLFFGWIFLGIRNWLLLEVALIFLFYLQGYYLRWRLRSKLKREEGIIDIKAEVLDKHKTAKPHDKEVDN